MSGFEEIDATAELTALVQAQAARIADLESRLNQPRNNQPIPEKALAQRGPGRSADTAPVGRRGLLKAVVAGIAGLVGGSMLAPQHAQAETESSPEVAPNVVVTGPAPASGIGVDVPASSGGNPNFATAVSAVGSKYGVYASAIPGATQQGAAAVWALGQGGGTVGVFGGGMQTGDGVHGVSTGGIGVHGEAVALSYHALGVAGVLGQGQYGVIGLIPGAAIPTNQEGDAFDLVGVYGDGRDPSGNGGVGVRGISDTRDGVAGTSTSYHGVYGISTSGQGVRGDSTDATGIYGYSTNGLGGQFQGGLAPLRLLPAATPGHPTGGYHQRGELFVDANGALWYCSSDGYPGVWKQLA